MLAGRVCPSDELLTSTGFLAGLELRGQERELVDNGAEVLLNRDLNHGTDAGSRPALSGFASWLSWGWSTSRCVSQDKLKQYIECHLLDQIEST